MTADPGRWADTCGLAADEPVPYRLTAAALRLLAAEPPTDPQPLEPADARPLTHLETGSTS